MLRTISLKAKLLLLCLVLSAVSVVVGILNFKTSRRIVSQYNLVTTENMPKLERVNEMFLQFRSLRIALRTLGYDDLPDSVAQAALEKVQSSIDAFEKLSNEYAQEQFVPGEAKLFDQVMASWKRFRNLGEKILAKYEKRQDLSERKLMMRYFYYDCPEYAENFRQQASALTSFHKTLTAERVISVENDSKRSNIVTLALIFSGTLLGMILGYYISNTITADLRRVSLGLIKKSDAVNEVALQLRFASEELSASTSRQSSALQETSSAIEETSKMIAKNAENAKASSSVSHASESSVERGRKAVEAVVQSIREIAASNTDIMVQIEESNQEIANIVRVIGEIESKTKVINDIVFQTKLLSFNASVEAARAGEHGKGFAVVAEEVGKLAQMSGNSAKDISELLERSILEVEQTIEKTQARVTGLIQDARVKVQASTGMAADCNAVLTDIVEKVAHVGSLVSEISDASQEQSRGVSEINHAMAELDTVAHQNHTAADATAQSAETLQSEVESVRKIIDDLNAVLNGSRSITGKALSQVERRQGSSELAVDSEDAA